MVVQIKSKQNHKLQSQMLYDKENVTNEENQNHIITKINVISFVCLIRISLILHNKSRYYIHVEIFIKKQDEKIT